MRVIRYGSGWDIALDIVFTEKHTAHTIAERIGNALPALVRDAVDTSMRGHNAPKDAGDVILRRVLTEKEQPFRVPVERGERDAEQVRGSGLCRVLPEVRHGQAAPR